MKCGEGACRTNGTWKIHEDNIKMNLKETGRDRGKRWDTVNTEINIRVT
jgi:hypothetical protein